jgi:hypothetical protein
MQSPIRYQGHVSVTKNNFKGGDDLVSLETTDIFRGAFLLASGGDLTEVRIRNNGKRIATFLITGQDLDRLDSDYRCGRALINPLKLRESLNHLRDAMFEKLRESDPASPKGYAVANPATRKRYAGTRGRMRNDRQREDRGHQAWR